MDYQKSSTADLLEALGEQERHPDLKLIQALLERNDEVVPDLVDVVETETGWPQIHAALLLCELGAESALPALQRAISAPQGRNLADWLVEDALEKFGPPVLDMLQTIAADKAVEWYQRAVACRVMMRVAYRHPETYERVTGFLRGLLPDPNLDWRAYGSYEAIKQAVDDPQIWTSVVGRLCDLRDPEAYDLIGRLFQAGLIDELVRDAASYREAYQKSGPPAGFSPEPMGLVARYESRRPKKSKSDSDTGGSKRRRFRLRLKRPGRRKRGRK